MKEYVRSALRAAEAARQSGDLERAETLLRSVLERDSSQAETLYALARLALRRGRDREAADLLQHLVRKNPGVAQLHADLAVALQNLGTNDEGAAAARRALAIAPDHLSALNTLGNALRALGDRDEAARCFGRAIELAPRVALLHLNLASTLRDDGRPAEALAAYRRALEIEPENAELNLLAATLEVALGRREDARASLSRAVAIRPDLADAHVVLGNLLLESGDPEAAAASQRTALEIRPEMVTALDGLGNALRALGQIDEAALVYRRALDLRPEYAEAHCNLSTVCLDLGDLEGALDHARRALAIDPRLADAHFNLAQALLTRGELFEGWGHYEYRLIKSGANELEFPFPVWTGEALAERTVFVTAEQGVGDEILFASCIPDLQRAAGTCVVECDARLAPLHARSFPGVIPVPRLASPDEYPAALPRPDCRVAIGSLPLHFRDDLRRFPRRAAYLAPDPAAVDRWRARLAGLGPGLQVGISWRGGKEAHARRARSIPLGEWTDLGKARELNLINLQYGDTAAEREAARESTGLVVHDFPEIDPLRDLDGFAALIAALDLVISVDNATVHLAGALGAPTWVLLPFVADWRWMQDREDTPWYPTLRLFRQRSPGAWGEVLARASRELSERVGDDARPRGRPTALEVREPALENESHPRRRAALVNDTTYWYHWGCTATSTAIVRALEERGHAVHRVPITGLQSCEAAPDALEAFDDPAAFRRYAAAHPWLLRELEPVERVVINGEGSLHGHGTYARKLLYLAYAAKVHLGKSVQIINHSCYPEPGGERDSPAWRLYRKVYQAVDFAAIREPASHRLMTAAGFPVVQSCDCLPLYVDRHLENAQAPSRAGIVIAGSVAMEDASLEAWIEFIARMAGESLPVRALLGANLFPAPEERAFVRALAQRAGGALEVVEASSVEQWLDTLAGAQVLVSGRFHHTIAAASLGTPFVLLDSNTPKNSGLAELLDAPVPLPLDHPDLATELAVRAEAALARGAAPARGKAVREKLCRLALENFRELPAPRMEPVNLARG